MLGEKGQSSFEIIFVTAAIFIVGTAIMGNFFEVVDYVVAPAIVKEKLVSIFATDESLEEAYFIEKIEVTGAPPTVNIDVKTFPDDFDLDSIGTGDECDNIINALVGFAGSPGSTSWEPGDVKLTVNAGTSAATSCP